MKGAEKEEESLFYCSFAIRNVKAPLFHKNVTLAFIGRENWNKCILTC